MVEVEEDVVQALFLQIPANDAFAGIIVDGFLVEDRMPQAGHLLDVYARILGRRLPTLIVGHEGLG